MNEQPDIRCQLRYLAWLKLKAAVQGGYDSLLNSEQLDTVVGVTKKLCIVATDKTESGRLPAERPNVASWSQCWHHYFSTDERRFHGSSDISVAKWPSIIEHNKWLPTDTVHCNFKMTDLQQLWLHTQMEQSANDQKHSCRKPSPFSFRLLLRRLIC